MYKEYKNQALEVVVRHLLIHNHTIETIKLITSVNNYKELNIREKIVMLKNKNKK